MSLQSVILLRLGGELEFFSTPSAMYQYHTAEELGITRESLNNYFSRLGDQTQKVYKNDRCEIVKGVLKSGVRK